MRRIDRTSHRVVAAAIALGVAWPSSAHAQQTEQDKALALTLFKRGRELMDANRIDDACESFAESQRLDPGGGTLLNLAVCHERQGRTATAWAEFSDALALARRDQRVDRINLAQTRMAALEPKLSRLVITPPKSSIPHGLRVTRDGSDVPAAAWRLPVPVDPGHHVVEAFAHEANVFRAEVDVRPDGDVETITIVPSEVTPPSPAPAIASTAVVLPPPPSASSYSARVRATAGWSLVGAGVASLGMGTFFGVRALQKKSDSDEGCPAGRCTASAVDDNESAMTLADVSTATIAVGAAAVAAGVLLVVWPRTQARPSARATWQSLSVSF